MKTSSMNTHMGSISIDNEVIAQFAGSVANECFGIVGMADVNAAEGLVSLVLGNKSTKGIGVTFSQNFTDIKAGDYLETFEVEMRERTL